MEENKNIELMWTQIVCVSQENLSTFLFGAHSIENALDMYLKSGDVAILEKIFLNGNNIYFNPDDINKQTTYSYYKVNDIYVIAKNMKKAIEYWSLVNEKEDINEISLEGNISMCPELSVK